MFVFRFLAVNVFDGRATRGERHRRTVPVPTLDDSVECNEVRICSQFFESPIPALLPRGGRSRARTTEVLGIQSSYTHISCYAKTYRYRGTGYSTGIYPRYSLTVVRRGQGAVRPALLSWVIRDARLAKRCSKAISSHADRAS